MSCDGAGEIEHRREMCRVGSRLIAPVKAPFSRIFHVFIYSVMPFCFQFVLPPPPPPPATYHPQPQSRGMTMIHCRHIPMRYVGNINPDGRRWCVSLFPRCNLLGLNVSLEIAMFIMWRLIFIYFHHFAPNLSIRLLASPISHFSTFYSWRFVVNQLECHINVFRALRTFPAKIRKILSFFLIICSWSNCFLFASGPEEEWL